MTGRIEDLLVLLATDEATTRAFEDDPDALIARFRLDAEDAARLRSLQIDRSPGAARRLEERLSRSGTGFAAALHDAVQANEAADSGEAGDEGSS
ncbi:hypothetical protein, partial [Actinomycetospora chlora]|uniref:hypothetical protein n=1 Tax=Actinomycetospora chlora TaxID=663608 RepID=UPI0031EBC168